MVLRICRTSKTCVKCKAIIELGKNYWSGPYKSLCEPCYELEKTEIVSLQNSEVDNYIVSGTCFFCEQPAVGILWNKKVCAAHINQVITESL